MTLAKTHLWVEESFKHLCLRLGVFVLNTSRVIGAATVINTPTFIEFEGNLLLSWLNQETDILVAQFWILCIQLVGLVSNVILSVNPPHPFFQTLCKQNPSPRCSRLKGVCSCERWSPNTRLYSGISPVFRCRWWKGCQAATHGHKYTNLCSCPPLHTTSHEHASVTYPHMGHFAEK